MLSVVATSIACEKKCAPGFDESSPLKTSTIVRLSVQCFREEESTCSLAVWACLVPPSVMQHAVLPGRDSWMRLNSRPYSSLPPWPSDQSVFGEPRKACPLTPSTPSLRMEVSIYAARALQASICPTILDCLQSTWFATMAPRHSLDTTWLT